MKHFLMLLMVIFFAAALCGHASAQELAAPAVPSDAAQWMPQEDSSFGAGLEAIAGKLLPEAVYQVQQAVKTGIGVFCCALLVSILNGASPIAQIAGAVCITTLMLTNSQTMISLAAETVSSLSEYSKLFFPVMAAAASAQGSLTSSTALCIGTSAFSGFLSGILRRVLIPVVYLFLASAVGNCALGEAALKNIRDQLKKLFTWFLKTVLALFLTYMSVTGAVTGAADKTAVKTAKAAISAIVPVIGKNLADASEALLLSADLVKNSIGVYGIFAFAAIFLSPFLRIGAQYLVLKAAAALCGILDCKRLTGLIEDFSTAMGLLLGMIGSMCALSMIGAVCFMKGAL